ncbi:phosphate regulon sensor histidine kinase PhoR [Reinekea marinisedimentorum]|uniref:Phosphate regulon sensor protein PhoR n=1 Tax=Reinekea marinisedimentorum TaxID=230495 RepID=A0A4R3HV41_9GAMM|nr:phosphate regulon sensor histidine kinase PhoR [Reinekea marinisedimentorum]TCS35915.1 two-component system phosphate regulon sensor histidine kinase PhoR [Reinekea marinisedimentorum]
MIRDIRQSYYQKLIVSFIGVITVGYLFGHPWLFVSLATISYLLWLLFQMNQLVAWLASGAKKAPPESSGLWGSVFDHLYKVQRDHLKQIRNYHDVFRRIRASTEALTDGIMVLDSSGAIQWWNSAAKDLLCLKQIDDGQLLTNLIRDPKFIKFYHRQRYHEPLTMENPARQHAYIQISMTLYGKGERLLLIRDVTRLKQLEQMRQDFVANASHELKTPLTVLKGHLENILTFSENLEPPVEKALHTMNTQTVRMTNLINDLLLLTRLDNESSTRADETIDMVDFIEQVAADGRDFSGQKAHIITVNTQCEHELRGNKGEIRSAINNLVFNAINYSPAGSNITISWQKAASGAILSVQDEGEGIDQYHIPRLTERFYRADAGRSSETGGTGLGLAIAKHALARHNARLDIMSQKNKGSVFSCVFPEDRIIAPALAQVEEAEPTELKALPQQPPEEPVVTTPSDTHK